MGYERMDGVRNLSEIELVEIAGFSQKARDILEYDENEKSENIVKMIETFIGCAYKDEKLSKESKQELAFSMGSLWAEQIIKKFGWGWKNIDSKETGYRGFFIVSADEKFCCPVFQLFSKIVTGKNVYEGENDNTIGLIYNKISELDYNSCNDKYNVIW